MKLLRVITSMDPAYGGPCQGIRNSIPELEKKGVLNEVVCCDSPNASYLGKDKFVIHALGTGKGPWKRTAELIPWLMKNIDRFDAVIVHGLWLYHSFATVKALKKLEKQQEDKESIKKVTRLFIMPHGMLDPYFQKASGRKIKAFRNWIYWKLIEGSVINRADGVLFTCETELKLAREPFRPYLPKKELNVGYGITAPPLYNERMRNSFIAVSPGLQGQPYLLFLSRIHEKKGIDLLVRAYGEILEEALKVKTQGNNNTLRTEGLLIPKLVIAGPGLQTPYGKQVQKLAKSTEELINSVYFLDMLSGDTKWGAFYGCEAFILPSHQENFGIAVVEALACSKPVLISDQVNIWYEVEADGAALVAHDTLNGIKDLIKSWLSLSPEKRLSMGRQARHSYEKNYSTESSTTKLLEALS